MRLKLTHHWGVTEEQAIGELRESIVVKRISGTDLVEMRDKCTSPQNAQDMATEIADLKNHIQKLREESASNIILLTQTQSVQKEFETQMKLFTELQAKLAITRLQTSQRPAVIHVHKVPTFALAPISPNISLNLVRGSAVGFLLGLLISLLIRIFSR